MLIRRDREKLGLVDREGRSYALRSWSAVVPWIIAARLRTLPAALCPVIFAAAVAYSAGSHRWGLWVVVAICGSLIQVICNFANDLHDFLKGADTDARIGPQRAVQAGLISPKQMRYALRILVGISVILGIVLVFAGGWPILVIGIVSLVCAFAYTTGPHPLAYRGLGELFVMIFFGPIPVYGTLLIMGFETTVPSLIIGAGIAAIATALLVVNNVRDREQDELVAKRTLAVRLGEPWCRFEYFGWMTLAACAPVGAWLCEAPAGVLAGIAIIPFGWRVAMRLYVARCGADYGLVLKQTVFILGGYTAAVSIGWLSSVALM